MREIKFKFWSEREKKFCNNAEYIARGQYNNIDLYDLFIDDHGEVYGTCDNSNDGLNISQFNFIIPIQYTGLKDKNGVEIYEGDICYIAYFDNNGDDSWATGVIEFNLESAGYCVKDSYGYHGIRAGDNIEIIGNIYENPELLDQ